jgi:hypothetical protein
MFIATFNNVQSATTHVLKAGGVQEAHVYCHFQ